MVKHKIMIVIAASICGVNIAAMQQDSASKNDDKLKNIFSAAASVHKGIKNFKKALVKRGGAHTDEKSYVELVAMDVSRKNVVAIFSAQSQNMSNSPFVNFNDNYAAIYSQSGALQSSARVNTPNIFYVSYNREGKCIALGGKGETAEGEIIRLDIYDNEFKQLYVAYGNKLGAISYISWGEKLLAASIEQFNVEATKYYGGRIALYDASTAEEIPTDDLWKDTNYGRLVIAANKQGDVAFVDPRAANPNVVNLLHTSKFIEQSKLKTNAHDSAVSLQHEQFVERIQIEDDVRLQHVSFSPEDTYLACAGVPGQCTGIIHLLEGSTHSYLRSFISGQGDDSDAQPKVSWTSDERYIGCIDTNGGDASNAGAFYVFDVNNKKSSEPLITIQASLVDGKITPDGKTLVLAGSNGKLHFVPLVDEEGNALEKRGSAQTDTLAELEMLERGIIH